MRFAPETASLTVMEQDSVRIQMHLHARTITLGLFTDHCIWGVFGAKPGVALVGLEVEQASVNPPQTHS